MPMRLLGMTMATRVLRRIETDEMSDLRVDAPIQGTYDFITLSSEHSLVRDAKSLPRPSSPPTRWVKRYLSWAEDVT